MSTPSNLSVELYGADFDGLFRMSFALVVLLPVEVPNGTLGYIVAVVRLEYPDAE
jgi:hypothetical protein